MASAYSQDLRDRVIDAVVGTKTRAPTRAVERAKSLKDEGLTLDGWDNEPRIIINDVNLAMGGTT